MLCVCLLNYLLHGRWMFLNLHRVVRTNTALFLQELVRKEAYPDKVATLRHHKQEIMVFDAHPQEKQCLERQQDDAHENL